MVMKSNPKGGYTSARITFLPEEEYETADPLLIQYIKGEVGDCRQKSAVRDDLIEDLKAHDIPYEIKKCGTCATSQPRVLYNPFKITKE